MPQADGMADLLRARLHLERKEHAAARQLLDGLIAQAPQAPEPRRLLSYVLLQELTDPDLAETTLRELIALASGDGEARHNLTRLLRQRGCLAESASARAAGQSEGRISVLPEGDMDRARVCASVWPCDLSVI